MKKALIVLALALACGRKETAEAPAPPAQMPSTQPAHDMTQMAEMTDTAAPDAPILRLKQLYRPTASALEAYQAAAQIPEQLDGMYCYCHCHQHMKHRSLRTCFQTHHAEECNVCQQEAIMALDALRSGKSIKDAQRAADAAFNGGNPPPTT